MQYLIGNIRQVSILVTLTIIYYLSGKIGLFFAFEQINTSPIWPPTGVAIAALWCLGLRFWPSISVGALLTAYFISHNFSIALVISIGNTLEAVIGAYMLNKYIGKANLTSLQDIFNFMVTLMMVTMISAMFGVGGLLYNNVINIEQFYKLWLTWWIGNVAGGLLFIPLLITWRQWPQMKFSPRRLIELSTILLLTSWLVIIIFLQPSILSANTHLLTFALIPLLVCSALRFYFHGATALMLFISVIAIYGTIHGHGPFVLSSPSNSLLLLQVITGSMMTMLLLILGNQAERLQTLKNIINAKNTLQQTVTIKTEELKGTKSALIDNSLRQRELFQALEKFLQTIDQSDDESNFFINCAKGLAEAFNAQFSLIGKLSKEKTKIETIALCNNGQQVENFSYDLAGTPCEDVMNLNVEFIPSQVASLYPKDKLLLDMGIEGYCGAPLITEKGEAIGIIVVMDTQPILDREWLKPILKIFSNRITMELRRRQIISELKTAASVFKESSIAIIICDAQQKIIKINPQFTKLTGYEAREVIGHKPNIWKSNFHNSGFYQKLWKTLSTQGIWQGEIVNKRKNGDIYTSSQIIKVVQDEHNNIIQYISMFHDVTDKKLIEEKLYRLAHSDLITNLPNRFAFHKSLENALKLANKANTQLAVMFIDLDHFKLINDTSGHPVGDELLAKVALRLQKCIGTNNTISRFGGDEFTVLIPNISTIKYVTKIAEQILTEFTQPFKLTSCDLIIGASIGIGMYPENGHTVSSLLSSADNAMYCAKENGRNKFQFYTKEMQLNSQDRVKLEQDIRIAIEKQEFTLFFQPQIDIYTGKLSGAEALIRWFHPSRGLISPEKFIAIAEVTGLIVPLGDWIINEAFAHYAKWQAAGLSNVTLSINLSARQFHQHNLIQSIEKALSKKQISAKNIIFEITESLMMEDIETTLSTLQKIKALGCSLSMDDFGTGYSSLSYLKRFPIDELKIDKSFIQGLPTDADDAVIVSAIIAVAKALNIKVLAEGVETQDQLNILKTLKCGYVQGYFYAKPMPSDEFLNYYHNFYTLAEVVKR